MRSTSLFLWTNSEPSGKLQPQGILGKNALSSWAFLKVGNSPLPNSIFTSLLWSVRISIYSSLFPHRANVLIPSGFMENTAPWCLSAVLPGVSGEEMAPDVPSRLRHHILWLFYFTGLRKEKSQWHKLRPLPD